MAVTLRASALAPPPCSRSRRLCCSLSTASRPGGLIAAPPGRAAPTLRAPQRRRRQVAVTAGKRAAVATVAPAAAAPGVLLDPAGAFGAATYVMVPVYLVLSLAPRSRLAKAILETPLLPLGFGLAYAVLAWQAWHSGALELVRGVLAAARPLPDAALLAGLFQDKTLAALAWLHLLLLDFLTARAVLLDGLRQLVPTAHSVWLCFMVGPLGLLSHLATRFVVLRLRGKGAALASGSMWQ